MFTLTVTESLEGFVANSVTLRREDNTFPHCGICMHLKKNSDRIYAEIWPSFDHDYIKCVLFYSTGLELRAKDNKMVDRQSSKRLSWLKWRRWRLSFRNRAHMVSTNKKIFLHSTLISMMTKITDWCSHMISITWLQFYIVSDRVELRNGLPLWFFLFVQMRIYFLWKFRSHDDRTTGAPQTRPGVTAWTE